MEFRVLLASMVHSKEDGYVAKVAFAVAGHREPYEITLNSKSGKDWAYSLLFLAESGPEEEILAVEDELEENDEAFDQLVAAAREASEHD